MWVSHDSFYVTVLNVWKVLVLGNHMQKVMAKLKVIKFVLKVWNFSTFGFLKDCISAAKA